MRSIMNRRRRGQREIRVRRPDYWVGQRPCGRPVDLSKLEAVVMVLAACVALLALAMFLTGVV